MPKPLIKSAAPAAPAAPAPTPEPKPKPEPKAEVKPAPKAEAPAPKVAKEESKPKPPPPPKETAPPKAPAASPPATKSAPAAGTVEPMKTEMVGRRGPLAALGIGAPVYQFTEEPSLSRVEMQDATSPVGRFMTEPAVAAAAERPSTAPDVADLWMMRPHIEAIRRVEQLRSEGKIGPQVRDTERPMSGTATTMRYPAAQPKRVSPKAGKPELMRAPDQNYIERPTAQELDVPLLGAQKLAGVIQERSALDLKHAQNQKIIRGLEAELATARSPATIDPTQSRAAQMEVRAQRMGEISGKLREMAAKQRALTTQMAAKEATMREYGMTEEEINPQ